MNRRAIRDTDGGRPRAGAAVLALLVAFALAACERDDFWERPLEPSGPIALDRQVAWLVAGEPAVVLYDPAADGVTRLPLPAAPVAAHPAPDGRGLLVLDAADGATWLRFDGQGRLERRRRYIVGAPFDAVAWSPDGRFAVVHHGERGASGAVVTNPNQIALIDLDAAPGEGNPVRRSLRSFGAVPQSVVIGPPVRLGETERHLAWVLSERYLALLDLAAPTAREVVVHLTLPDDPRDLVPEQVRTAEVDGRPMAFVRAVGSEDIIALSFPDDAEAGAVPRPVLNQLPCGGYPTDFVVAPLEGGPRVVAVTGVGGAVAMLDPRTGRGRLVEAGVRVSRILPFEAARPDGAPGRFALLWSPGGEAVVFADLDQLEARAARALTPLRLEGNVTAVEPLPGRRGALAVLAEGRLVLLDFDERTATPLVLAPGARLTAAAVDPSGERVYAAVTAPGDEASLVAVDVATGAPSAAPVGAPGEALLLLPGAGRLVLHHADPYGWITVAPLADPADADLHERAGLLLEGILDR